MALIEETSRHNPRDPKRVLVMRNDRLGDLVLSLPLLRQLRAAFPRAYLGALVSPYTAPLLRGHPDLDMVVEDRGGDAELAARLRAEEFQVALVLWANRRNARLAARAGIRHRVGPSWRPFSGRFNHRLDLRRSRGLKGEADYNLEFLRPLGLEPAFVPARLRPDAAARRRASAWLRASAPQRGRGPLVALHPGSGGSAQNWPVERYARLGLELVERHGARLLVSGGPGEVGLVEACGRALGGRAALLRGALDLPAFAALLGRCDLFVSASTGPMHLAAALGTPTLSLFPPLRPMSPLRWGPRGNRHAVLTPRGLGLRAPASGVNYVERISAAEAADAAAFLLRAGRR